MVKVTITPNHARLQAFLAGKGHMNAKKETSLDLSPDEARSLMRKAEAFGFEADIKVHGKIPEPEKPDAKGKAKVVKEESETGEDEMETSEGEEPAGEGEEQKPARRRRIP